MQEDLVNKKLQFFSRLLVFVVITLLLIPACTPDIEKLISQGDVKGLIRALENDDTDRARRQQIVEKLGELGDERAVWTLIRSLKDDYTPLRNAAVDALINIGAPAVEPLLEAMIEALDEGDIALSSDIIYVLGNIGDSRAVVPLIGMLNDDNGTVRRKAAVALGTIGDMRAVQTLINALQDNDKRFRGFVAEALGEIGDASAVWPLLVSLKDPNNIEYFDEHAAEALVKIGPSAVEPLIDALHFCDRVACRHAKEALINIGDPAVEPLIELLKDKEWGLYDYADNALVSIGAPAVEPLIKALNEKDGDLRKRVIKTLGDIHDARAVEPLIEMLNDDDRDVQESVAVALGKIGDKRTLNSLITNFGFNVPGNYGWINSAIRDTYLPICKAFASVVNGQGVADAAFYNSEISGPRPLIVLQTDGAAHWWNDSLPLGWAPFSQSDVEFVVVVNKEELELTGNRIYIIYINGEEVNRFAMNGYRHKLDVQVIEARTGTVLKSTTLYGSHPRFPDSLSFIPKVKSIGGAEVSFNDFILWWMGEGVNENS